MGLTHVRARIANPSSSANDDAVLLGSVSLESVGLMLDPMKRVLRPIPMVLGQIRPVRR